MKYVKCPTCGGSACYVSENFERAGILISQENDQFKKELEYISEQLEVACQMVEKKIENMTSDQIFFLYRKKLQQEIIIKQKYTDKTYEEMDKLVEIGKQNFSKLFREL